MALILSLLLVVYAEVTDLSDGVTKFLDSNSLFGSENIYKFHVATNSSSDLTISLTTYSDYSDPDMLVSVNEEPTLENYLYSSLTWGSGSIIVPGSELQPNSDYYVLVVCYTFCRYGLTISFSEEIVLNDGLPVSGSLLLGKQAIYKFFSGSSPGDSLEITVSHLTGLVEVYAAAGESEPTSDNSLPVFETWDQSLQFIQVNPAPNTYYRIAIMALEPTSFIVLAKTSATQASLVQASVATPGEVDTGNFNFYYINVDDPNETLYIGLTVFSGDADIYIKAGELPSLNTFDFLSVNIGNENLAISAEQRKRIGFPTGKYFIGIFGMMHAAYSLLVTTSNSSFVLLQSGFPQSGSLNNSEVEYYYAEYPPVYTNITVSLSVGSGNPDLYVKLCSQDLSSCYFNFSDLTGVWSSKHLTGGENIDIAHNPTLCPRSKVCHYIIGVKGEAVYSTFTVLMTVGDGESIVLREGRPQTLSIGESGEKYFRYSVINSTVFEVSFMITPVYGDPDVYSKFNMPIDYFNYDKSSINLGVEIDQVKYIRGIDSDSLVGTYYIMVRAFSASTFSIVAKETIPGWNTTIQIYPGHPQKDTIYNFTNSDYRIYFFPVHFDEETKQDLVITLMALTGSFEVYVANQLSNLDWKKEIFYYNWKSTNANSSDPNYVITIKTNDFWYRTDSTYLVLVMGHSYLPDKSATYMLSYSTGEGTVTLSEDVPFTGVVVEDTYSYYSFPIHYSHEDVTLSLTVLSGDADLYVSVDPKNPNPTKELHNFKSTMFGSEILTLVWENGLREICGDLPENYQFGDKAHCFLYIGVYGFHTSTYSVRVHPSKNLPRFQSLGQPVTGFLNSTMFDFYYTIIDTTNDFSVSLQPTFGDSDLFLNVFDKNESGSDINKWPRPNTDSSMFASRSTAMSDEISIPKDELHVLCPSGSCIAIAAVYCFTEACGYTFSMRQNQIVQLIENKPTYGVANFTMTYFSYYCDKDSTNFLVSVTALNEGNPDIYVKKGSDKLPSLTDFDWYSANWGGDSILITKNDHYFNDPVPKSMKGTYIIGVNSLWESVSFSIVVNNNPQPIIAISSGLPQYGNLEPNTMAFYQFNNFIGVDVQITLTPISGEGDLYATTYNGWEGDIYTKLPNENNYIWSSKSNSDRYSLTINPSDTNFCIYCSILVAVKSTSIGFSFNILAKNKLDFFILQNGIPSKTESTNNDVKLYSFEVNRKVDIHILVTPYAGHPDIHVSTLKNLTWESYMWQAYYIQNTLNLRISKDDQNFKIGKFYIIISSYGPSSYSIIAHTKDNPVTLIDGWPIAYKLNPEPDFINFRFITNSGRLTFCNLKAEDNFRPTVVTNFQSINAAYNPPTNVSYENIYTSTLYNQRYQSLAITLPHAKETNSLNLGVYSTNNNGTKEGTFQIYCSSTAQTTLLRANTMHIETLDQDVRSRRYEIVTEGKGTLNAYVIPCIGEFHLEISSNWTIIKQEVPDVVVNRLTDGVVEGSISNAEGRYFISISGLHSNSSDLQIFELLTTFTKNGETVHKRFNPGKNGLLTWSSEPHRRVNVSWSPVEGDDLTPIENSGAEYRVYFTSDKSSNLLSACGVHYFHSLGKLEFLGSTSETSLVVELPETKGFINVIAVLPKTSVSPIKEIVYDPTEVLLSTRTSSNNSWIFFVLAFLLLIAVGASIYFYKKKQKAEEILNYELEDVRNVAAVSDKPVQRVDPYAPLSNP